MTSADTIFLSDQTEPRPEPCPWLMVSPYFPWKCRPRTQLIRIRVGHSRLTYNLLCTRKAVGPACRGWARSRRSNAAIGEWKRSCKERVRFHPPRSHSVRLCNPPISSEECHLVVRTCLLLSASCSSSGHRIAQASFRSVGRADGWATSYFVLCHGMS